MLNITESGVVYLLTSPSGKQYVGQTWNLEKRLRQYSYGKCVEQPALHAAIVKYGRDTFTATIIACGIQTQDALDKVEDAFIVMLNTLSPNGYNLKRGGKGMRGWVPSRETRDKISVKLTGRKDSTETRKKKSDAAKGKPKSPEHRKAMSEAQRGEKHHYFGKHLSPEHCAKLSASNTGKKRSPETCKRIGAANRGKKRSPEARKRMSIAQQAYQARKRAAEKCV